MSKCDFNKVVLQHFKNYTSAWVLSCKFAAYFQNTFLKEHLRRTASAPPMYSNWNWLFLKNCKFRMMENFPITQALCVMGDYNSPKLSI